MDTTESQLQPEPQGERALALSQEAQYYLQQSGKWASFLGIVGFVFTGLLVLAAFFANALMSFMSRMSPNPSPFNIGPILTVVYLLGAIFYFFFSFYLYQFGTRVKKGVAFTDSNSIEGGLEKLKSFFKMWGICTIVIIVLYAVIFIGAIVIGASALSH